MAVTIKNRILYEVDTFSEISLQWGNGCIIHCLENDSWWNIKGGVLNEQFVKVVVNEVLVGTINGSNSTFTTNTTFNSNKLIVYVNGIKQNIITDYQILNNNTIQFTFSPNEGEILTTSY